MREAAMNPMDNNLRIGLEQAGMTDASDRRNDALKPNDLSFKDVLTGLVDKVDSLQKDADASIKGLVTGETTNIHDVAVKMKEAEVAFSLMMEVRNKLVDAYQEIMKMQP
ncbi:MAG: flagellar hook-basal body complex protein FliE [Spartobacteria bacterium]|nr:flagellar hook-basal body complex protein FliE [Spartobacteria bacterium]